MLSCIYLTRACPYKCRYCALRDSPLQGPELSAKEWGHAFAILHDLGVEFDLLLGNELLARDDIVEIVKGLNKMDVPYGFYTTCPPKLMDKHAAALVGIGLSNASSGFDILTEFAGPDIDPYILHKSELGLQGLKWFRDQGVPDLQGTMTLSKINVHVLDSLIGVLTSERIWCGVNTIHWDVDGGFDFFPKREVIENLLLTQEDIDRAAVIIQGLYTAGKLAIQNPLDYWDAWREYGVNLNWHCNLPMIYTVDADGSMRCCGYRKGTYSPQFTIFDLETQDGIDAFWEAWLKDQRECPGCFWAYGWLAERLLIHEEDKVFGLNVFQTHDSKTYSMAC